MVVSTTGLGLKSTYDGRARNCMHDAVVSTTGLGLKSCVCVVQWKIIVLVVIHMTTMLSPQISTSATSIQRSDFSVYILSVIQISVWYYM